MKHLKQHYLNHSKEVSAGSQTEVGDGRAPEAVEEEKNVESEAAGVLLQENSISSSDSSREAGEDQPGLSRPELDPDYVSRYEERKVETDISPSQHSQHSQHKLEEVAQLNSTTRLSTDSEKVKCDTYQAPSH